MFKSKLILMRHGQSLYNLQNRFTGWSDVDLSKQGVSEAKAAGSLLKKHELYPDICFTSWLKRAIHTANIALKELEWEHIDAIRSYKLNERHYGAWQGRNKYEVKQEVGEEMFFAVRRGYETAPPPLDYDEKSFSKDRKYALFLNTIPPRSESLKDTRERVTSYYEDVILKELIQGKDVLISAHGNSLRALVMYLEKMSIEDVVHLEIPTGEIIVYTFDEMTKIVKKEVLIG